MKLFFCLSITFIASILLSCSLPNEPNTDDPSTDGNDLPQEIAEGWQSYNGWFVYYSELGIDGSNQYQRSSSTISGSGTIEVDINKVSGASDLSFGMGYITADYNNSIDISFKQSGQYRITWNDNPEDDPFNSAGRYSSGWMSSAFVNSGLDVINAVSIAYDTDDKTYSIYINDNLIETHTFENMGVGFVAYDLWTDEDGNSSTPYRYDFRTTSPFVHP